MAAESGGDWIFVSTANKDRKRAESLLGALAARGLALRRYENLIRPGVAWEGAIAEVRSNAGAMLVLWSQAASASEFVLREASVGADAGILVGAALDGLEMVPSEFRTTVVADLDGWHGEEKDPRLDRLGEALATAVRSPDPSRLDAETIRSLSPSVATVRDRLGPLTPVPALAIVRVLAELHPEFGDRALGRAALAEAPEGEPRAVDEWIRLATRSSYARPGGGSSVAMGSGPFVNGRVLLAALADADTDVRAALGESLLIAVQRELGAPGVLGTPRVGDREWPGRQPSQERRPPEPELAGHLDTDLVPWGAGTALVDQLRVSTYVKMLATVVATRDTPMPLSIGLFGEWGSGKSYFMGLMQQEIGVLAARARADHASPFCSEIMAVHFNAWHYADANLWASLAVRLFDKLAHPDDDHSAEQAEARQVMLTELRTYKEAEAALLEKEERANQALEAAENALRDAELQEETAVKELNAETVADLADAVASDGRVKSMLDTVRIDIRDFGLAAEPGIADLPKVAGELKAASTDVARIWRMMRSRDPKRAVRTAVLAVVFGVAGVTLLALPGAVRALGAPSLAVALAALSWLIRSGNEVVVPLRRALSYVESTLYVADRAWDVVEQRHQELIDTLQRRVAGAREQQQELARQQLTAQESVDGIRTELKALEAGPRLYRFIAERAASNDYRKQLGIVSLIRQDFEELTRRLFAAKDLPNGADAAERALERIVLYIDDLDRCPPERVVQVLEAVHLLLAMELFVVVVGVDPRWLLRSLRRQFREVLTPDTDDDASWQSTPQNYLEKIFQIPFVLPAMTAPGFHTLLRSLVRPPAPDQRAPAVNGGDQAQLSVIERAGAARPGDPADIVAEKESTIERLSSGRKEAPLDLTDEEVSFLALLAPLVRTPRAAKRMVNVYRMLRVTRDLRPASTFLGRPDAAGDYQAVAQLLGVLTGYPSLLGPMCWGEADRRPLEGPRSLLDLADDDSWNSFVDAVEPRQTDTGWANAVDSDVPPSQVDDWQRLVGALRDVRPALTIEDRVAPYKAWAPAITRFSFEMSRFTTIASRV